jgi:exodeoxyribonuclease V alpha subunit
MTKLVDAVRPEAKLVLLGDKDQLASVDVGSILGDLYVEAESVGYSSEFGERLRRITGASVEIARDSPAGGLRDCRVHLSHSLRFSDASALGALSRAVQAGQASAALEVLKASKEVELRSFESKKGLSGALGELIRERFGKLGVGSVAEKLDILESFRILCCHRRGPLGVEAINAFVAEELGRSGCVDGTERFYEGRPILVTANDYRLELFNGDVGVVGPVPGADALAAELGQSSRMLAVFFPGSAPETWRSVSPGRLPSHETAFAMSVHKSQGSEFGEVVLILPDKPTQLVTRELIYTAITRARRRVVILGSASVLTHAIEARVERASGLRARLASS